MSADTHPHEIELFELVEGDLDDERRCEVAAHVAACASCADQIRLLEAGRDALREAPLLYPPERKREAFFERLPRQLERRGPAFSPKQLLAVLVPVAAIAAVVAVVTSSDGTGGAGMNERSAAPAETASALHAQEKSGAGSGGEAAPSADAQASAPEAAGAPVRQVAGPAEQVASLLREKGFDAHVVAGDVEVRGGASPSAVERALEDLRSGSVRVFVR